MRATLFLSAVFATFISAFAANNAVLPKEELNSSVSRLVEEIGAKKVFEEPLIPFADQPSTEESLALKGAIDSYLDAEQYENIAPFERFLSDFPTGVYVPSLLTNLGSLRYRQGYFSEAAACRL